MSTTLRRDMYGLKALGTPIDDVEMPELDPLAALRYSCVYWVDYLCDSNPTASATYAECLRDGGVVDRFLREKFLYWLESLSLCNSMLKGVVSMKEVRMLVQVCLQQVTCETSFILTVARDRRRQLYLLSLCTMYIDSLCTINKRSRVALFRRMDLGCCSAQSRV